MIGGKASIFYAFAIDENILSLCLNAPPFAGK